MYKITVVSDKKLLIKKRLVRSCQCSYALRGRVYSPDISCNFKSLTGGYGHDMMPVMEPNMGTVNVQSNFLERFGSISG